MLTTKQSASRLGLSLRQTQHLIEIGRLPATKLGRDWLIQEQDLERVRVRPHVGRPRKAALYNTSEN